MLRRFFSALGALFLCFGSVPAAPVRTETMLPILMYHEVKDTGAGKDCITPAELESDLRWLAQNGYTAVTMREVIAFVCDGAPLPDRPVVLSFDDGLRSVYTNAAPILERYGTRIVLSVIGRSADDFSAQPKAVRGAHATWTQLRELQARGIAEIQNHSYELHGSASGVMGCERRPGEDADAYAHRLESDLTQMQERTLAELGTVPAVFTYPYGKYSAESEGLLRELGFRASLTCDFGMNLLTDDPDCLMGMKRICRSHGANLSALLQQASDSLKWRS